MSFDSSLPNRINQLGSTLIGVGNRAIQRKQQNERLAAYEMSQRSMLESQQFAKRAEALGDSFSDEDLVRFEEEYRLLEEARVESANGFSNLEVKERALQNIRLDRERTLLTLNIMADRALVSRTRNAYLKDLHNTGDLAFSNPGRLPMFLNNLENPRVERERTLNLPTGEFLVMPDEQWAREVEVAAKATINGAVAGYVMQGRHDEAISYLDSTEGKNEVLKYMDAEEFGALYSSVKVSQAKAISDAESETTIADLQVFSALEDIVGTGGRDALFGALNNPNPANENYPTYMAAFRKASKSQQAKLLDVAKQSDVIHTQMLTYGPNSEIVFQPGERPLAEKRNAKVAQEAYFENLNQTGNTYEALDASIDRLNEFPLGFLPGESVDFILSKFSDPEGEMMSIHQTDPSLLRRISTKMINTLARDPRYERSRADNSQFEGQREILNLLSRGYSPAEITNTLDERRNISREQLHTRQQILSEKLSVEGYLDKEVAKATANIAAHRIFGYTVGPYEIDIPYLPRVDIGSRPEVPPEMKGDIEKLAQSELRSGKTPDQAMAEAIRQVTEVGRGGWSINDTQGTPFYEKDGIASVLDMDPIAAQALIYKELQDTGYWSSDIFGDPARGPVDVFRQERLTADFRTRYAPKPDGTPRWELIYAPGHEKEHQSYLSDETGVPYYITDLEKYRGAQSVSDLKRMDPDRFTKRFTFRQNSHDVYMKYVAGDGNRAQILGEDEIAKSMSDVSGDVRSVISETGPPIVEKVEEFTGAVVDEVKTQFGEGQTVPMTLPEYREYSKRIRIQNSQYLRELDQSINQRNSD